MLQECRYCREPSEHLVASAQGEGEIKHVEIALAQCCTIHRAQDYLRASLSHVLARRSQHRILDVMQCMICVTDHQASVQRCHLCSSASKLANTRAR